MPASALGCSQRELAARAGVAHSTVARVETVDRQPSVALWAKLLQAVGADVAVGDTAPAKRPPRSAKWSRPIGVPDDLTELKGPPRASFDSPGLFIHPAPAPRMYSIWTTKSSGSRCTRLCSLTAPLTIFVAT